MDPKVSVIIPTYNRANLVREAIKSVLNQTYRNFEIIVVDDGSTDDTGKLVGSFNSKIKYFYQENTGLPAKARNRGILEARGEYIAFLDSDDKWVKDKLAGQMDIFNRFPWIDLVFTGVIIIDKKGNVLKRKKGKFIRKNVLLHLVKSGSFVTNSSVVVRKTALLKVGSLDEDPRIRGSEDFFLWVKLAVNCNFYLVPELLTVYRRGNDSLCNPLGMQAVYNKVLLNKEIYSHINKARGKCLSRLHYELARYYFSHQDFAKAQKEFLKAIITNPGFLSCYIFWLISLLSFKIRFLSKRNCRNRG